MFSKPSPKPIILVVDDTHENLDVLKGALLPHYTVRLATNGPVALKIANIPPLPDLILLDIMMPEMDGYEVCRQLKADQKTRDIPVIFVTAKSAEADELMGLNLGAVDYITKPFSIPIVHARIKTHILLRNTTQMLAAHNKHLVSERALIERILLKMRGSDPFDDQHLRFLVSPVETTAGDLLLSTRTPDERQLILLGDFTGHGLSAAIGGPLVTYILHDLATRNKAAVDIITTLNKQLCARLPTGLFLAAAFIEIAPDRRSGLLWNAGLPACQLIRQGEIHTEFPSLSPPLGIIPSSDMASQSVGLTFLAKDCLYAFSDGIIEAHSPSDEMFGEARLQTFLLAASQGTQTLDHLIPLLVSHTGTTTFEDDITLAEIRL